MEAGAEGFAEGFGGEVGVGGCVCGCGCCGVGLGLGLGLVLLLCLDLALEVGVEYAGLGLGSRSRLIGSEAFDLYSRESGRFSSVWGCCLPPSIQIAEAPHQLCAWLRCLQLRRCPWDPLFLSALRVC